MEKLLIKKRKFNKETYKFYLIVPSYEGEKGCLGIEITPYVEVETPENCLGYPDYIQFNKKFEGYTLFRNCPNWIIRKCEDIAKDIMNEYSKKGK